MDLMSLLRYLFDHNQQVIGGLMVIILATAALLAMRMVAQEKSAAPSGGAAKGGGSNLDLGAIEAAFKRVLAAQGGGVAPAVAAPAAPSSGAGASASDISERDAKIQDLAREIDRLTAELNSRPSEGTGFGGTSAPAPATSDGSGQVDALQAKIAELESKLTEYEIIEDDIADLSRFKEENAELRGELEALKARFGGGSAEESAAPPGAEVAAPAAAAPESESGSESQEPNPFASLEAEVSELTSGEAVAGGSASPKPEAATAPSAVPDSAPPEPVAAKADLDEAMLKEFASSVEVQKGPAKVAPSSDLNIAVSAAALGDGSSILDASVDTEKMFEEVSTLAQSGESADDVLEGSLDTEKLLAEMSSLGTAESAPSKAAPGPAPASAASESAPGATPTTATAAPAKAAESAPAAAVPGANDESKFEDDLLAEFKDSNDGGQG